MVSVCVPEPETCVSTGGFLPVFKYSLSADVSFMQVMTASYRQIPVITVVILLLFYTLTLDKICVYG